MVKRRGVKKALMIRNFFDTHVSADVRKTLASPRFFHRTPQTSPERLKETPLFVTDEITRSNLMRKAGDRCTLPMVLVEDDKVCSRTNCTERGSPSDLLCARRSPSASFAGRTRRQAALLLRDDLICGACLLSVVDPSGGGHVFLFIAVKFKRLGRIQKDFEAN